MSISGTEYTSVAETLDAELSAELSAELHTPDPAPAPAPDPAPIEDTGPSL